MTCTSCGCPLLDGETDVCEPCRWKAKLAPPTPPLRDLPPRELLRGLMRGSPATFKAGYSAANAHLALQTLHVDMPDEELTELRAYADGFEDGLREGRREGLAKTD